MRVRLIAPATAALVAGVLGLTATSAAAAPAAAPSAASVNAAAATFDGTINQTVPGVGSFVGTFTPTGFARSGGQTMVTGLVQGTLTSLTGAITPVSQTVTTAVTAALATGSCTILDLTLGPLHLNLLGLVVDLNQVHLVITAQQGPGNLLGNLLCAVANLLNGGAPGGLANLLNQLLGLLRGV
jgi:hypothetical protein